ncbi:MAG: outer membrane beta-barrel protein [Petrimonas sp.]|jgi:opacity protein-like surface antigen
MRKFAYLSIIFLVLSVTKSFAQYERTVGLGAHTGYGTEIKSVGAGAHLHYYYTNNIRFAPFFTYYLPRKNIKVWEVNADAHYVVPVSWLFSFYPIAGLSYSNWKFDASKVSDIGLHDWTKHRVGANLGLGIQYDFGYKVRSTFEFKYQFMKDFSQLAVMVGVGFWL